MEITLSSVIDEIENCKDYKEYNSLSISTNYHDTLHRICKGYQIKEDFYKTFVNLLSFILSEIAIRRGREIVEDIISSFHKLKFEEYNQAHADTSTIILNHYKYFRKAEESIIKTNILPDIITFLDVNNIAYYIESLRSIDKIVRRKCIGIRVGCAIVLLNISIDDIDDESRLSEVNIMRFEKGIYDYNISVEALQSNSEIISHEGESL